MKNQKLNLIDNPCQLTILQEHFPGTISHFEDTSSLKIDTTVGSGTIRYHNLQDGLKAYDFDLVLNNDSIIPLNTIAGDAFQFLYCLKGDFSQQFEDEDFAIKIEQFQTAVTHNRSELSNTLFIKKGTHIILNSIIIDRHLYFKKINDEISELNTEPNTILNEINSQTNYFHSGGFSLKIAEQLQYLISAEYSNDVSEKLSHKGRYYIILAKQIEQFYLEITNAPNTSGLLKAELSEISKISALIIENPETQHSVNSLCHETGLSPAKLQDGFKYMYGRTVSDYIRNVRLEKAATLLKNTDLTISEIVYSVGLNSRSYFCKIFKKKYQHSPKEFKKK